MEIKIVIVVIDKLFDDRDSIKIKLNLNIMIKQFNGSYGPG